MNESEKFHKAALRFQRKNGWIPTWDQLQQFMKESLFTAGVQFPGSSRVYHYMAPYSVEEGQYLAVDSIMTGHKELVKVVEVDTDYGKVQKWALPIEWSMTK